MNVITRLNNMVLRQDAPKTNLTPYHSEDNPGLRANWLHASMAILACGLTYVSTTTHSSILTDIGVGVLLFPFAFVGIMCWVFRHKKFAKIVAVVDLVLVVLAMAFLAQDFHSVWSGFITIILLAALIACLAGATLTRWIPLGRDYEDRSVRKSRRAAEE